jgi:hypothetical protein
MFQIFGRLANGRYEIGPKHQRAGSSTHQRTQT